MRQLIFENSCSSDLLRCLRAEPHSERLARVAGGNHESKIEALFSVEHLGSSKVSDSGFEDTCRPPGHGQSEVR